MAVTFCKKYFTCNNCGNRGNELFAIKRNSDIYSEYPLGCRPEELKDNSIYTESLTRDDYGIIIFRQVKEKYCDFCKTYNLSADKVDNEDNVLNFYPRTEAHKWLDGLGKAGL